MQGHLARAAGSADFGQATGQIAALDVIGAQGTGARASALPP